MVIDEYTWSLMVRSDLGDSRTKMDDIVKGLCERFLQIRPLNDESGILQGTGDVTGLPDFMAMDRKSICALTASTGASIPSRLSACLAFGHRLNAAPRGSSEDAFSYSVT